MGLFSSLFGGGSSSNGSDKENNQQTKNDQKNFEILKYDGIRAQRMGKLPYAIKCFEEAVALMEEAETLQLLANAYLQANRLDEARQTLQRLTALTPTDFPPLLSLAHLCYMQEDYAGMNEACQKALALDSQHPQALYLAAKANIGLKNEIMALAQLTQAIVAQEDYTEAYLLRAELLWNLHQPKDATEDIEKLLTLKPDDEQALLLKGEMRQAVNEATEAEACFQQVLSLNPFNEKAYVLLGNLYLSLKDLDQALAVYDEALEINPNFAQAYQERGRVKLLKGDKDGSMADLKKALELAPESEAHISGEYHNYEQPAQHIPF